MLFVELYRRFGEHIFFLKNGSETDFVIHEKENAVYQICYDLNTENREREIKGCFDAMEKFNVHESYLITFEQEDELSFEGKTIKVLPFYRF
jgi:predicted AAA+ superfamily ATPase